MPDKTGKTGTTGTTAAPKPAWQQYTGTANTTVFQPGPYQPAVSIRMRLEQMTPANRKTWAEQLKKAGFNAPANGVIGPKYIDAVSQFEAAYSEYKAKTDPNITNRAFLQIKIQENEKAGATGGFAAGPRTSYKSISETDASMLINAVLKDTVGRGATKAELKKYTDMIRAAQSKNPTVTNYAADGTVRSTKGGLNEQEFLIQQIAKTDEAKANRVLGFYDAFKQALGVS